MTIEAALLGETLGMAGLVTQNWNLASATINGKDVNLDATTELGRRVYSTALDVPAGGTVTMALLLAAGDQSFAVRLSRQPWLW